MGSELRKLSPGGVLAEGDPSFARIFALLLSRFCAPRCSVFCVEERKLHRVRVLRWCGVSDGVDLSAGSPPRSASVASGASRSGEAHLRWGGKPAEVVLADLVLQSDANGSFAIWGTELLRTWLLNLEAGQTVVFRGREGVAAFVGRYAHGECL